jgi:predicted regulator of Ras-like GTPase activity (Roadblock/LC7/MglB family)
MNSIKNVLGDIRRRVEGARVVSVIAYDGIPVETVGEHEVPIETIGAEFASFFRSIRLSGTDLHTGEVEQLALVTERYVTFLSAITRDYFILLVLDPQGNYGRARFELGKARRALQPELS